MLTIISPSKTQDFSSSDYTKQYSLPALLNESEILIKELRKKSEADIAQLMTLSERLAALNVERYHEFHQPFKLSNAKQALLAFKGEVYMGFDLKSYKQAEFDFAQKHLCILSGLYGLLQPLDLIQPYRLEMKIKLKNPRGKDLYQFWGNRITDLLKKQLKDHKAPVLINLASNEYFKAINKKDLASRIITPVFKENKESAYKVIAIFAKKARGLMADFIIKNRIDQPEYLKTFSEANYVYNEGLSKENEWVFTRG